MSSNLLSSSVTQLSATSTSRAAFLQSLRWGIWCPFQEPADWKGEEIQLVLRGGAKPNPHGVMVYSTEMPAKTASPAPLSAPGTAQVTQWHRDTALSKEQNVKNASKGVKTKVLFSALTQVFPWRQKLSHYPNGFLCIMWCIQSSLSAPPRTKSDYIILYSSIVVTVYSTLVRE